MSGDGTGGGRRAGASKPGAANPSSGTFIALGKKPGASRAGGSSSAGLFATSDPVAPVALSAASSGAGPRRPPGIVPPIQSAAAAAASLQRNQARDALKPKPLSRPGISSAVPVGAGFSRPATSSNLLRPDNGSKFDSGVEWQKHAVEVADAKQFAALVTSYISGQQTNETQLRGFLCGIIKQLIQIKHKDLDELLLSSMGRLAVAKPELFRGDMVMSALIALFKRDPTVLKNTRTVTNCAIGVNLLSAVLDGVPRWPASVLKLYLEDAAMDRLWVDLAETKDFVRSIRYSFGTRASSAASPPGDSVSDKTGQATKTLVLDDPERRQSPSPLQGRSSPAPSSADDSMSESNMSTAPSARDTGSSRTDRFADLQPEIPQMINDIIASFRGTDGGKNLIRLLTSTAGVLSSRVYAMNRIDTWLQNSKTTNSALTLMGTVCSNCAGATEDDMGIISAFLKIRVKGKPHIDSYFQCLGELMERNSENIIIIFRELLQTELGDMAVQRRNPWNMAVMAAATKLKPLESSSVLGSLFASFVFLSPEDLSRNLKQILHDLARNHKMCDLRHDRFVTALLTSKSIPGALAQVKGEEQTMRDRKLMAIVDIVLAAEVLMMMTRFKEDIANGVFEAYVAALAPMQNMLIDFLGGMGKRRLAPSPETVRLALRKMFFLDKSGMFQLMDKWPTEHERSLLFKYAARIPVTSHLLGMLLLVMAPCEPVVILDMLEILIVRALGFNAEGLDVLRLQDLAVSFVEQLFQLGLHKIPEGVSFPPKHRPPQLVRKDVYWQCWRLVLLMAAADAEKFGAYVWSRYPTARALMQMVIINRFEFPPETYVTADKDKKSFLDREQKMAEEEKKSIVDLENRIAGGTAKTVVVTENTAKLPKEFTRYDIGGTYRQPPDAFSTSLERLNKQLELGKLLSGCRTPDFLLEMLKEKGTAASLPWLLELTTSSKSMFDVLPVECVCEMLSNSLLKKPTGSSDRREQDFRKCCNLATRLSDSIIGDNAEFTNLSKTLDIFGGKLCSDSLVERENAKVALEMFFDPLQIEGALTRLWGLTKPEPAVDSGMTRTLPEPLVKQGITIEGILSRTRPDAWCPEVTSRVPYCRSYVDKFKWLLVDIPLKSLDFKDLKDNLCLQLARALDVECDVFSVCAYLEFIARNMKPVEQAPREKMNEYIIMQIIASLMVERKDLRDAVFLGRGGTLTEEEIQRIRSITVDMFEYFINTACDTTPPGLNLTNTDEFLNDRLLRMKFIHGHLFRHACLSISVARAYVILLAVLPSGSARYGNGLLPELVLKESFLFLSKTWTTGEVTPLLTPEVRSVVVRHGSIPQMVDWAITGAPVSELLDLICCENIPAANLRTLVKAVDLEDRESVAALKFVADNHALVAAAALECRLLEGLKLEDPVHQMIQSTLSARSNPFSVPFL